MIRTPQPPGRGSERGAATLETVGMSIVASLVVVALLAVALPQGRLLGGSAAYWICQVVTVGQGGCTPPSSSDAAEGAGDDGRPAPSEPCVLARDGIERRQKIAAVAVTASDGRRIEYTRLSNGDYRVGVTDSEGTGGEVGVGGGLSFTAADVTVGGTANAQVGASLEVSTGDVYYVDQDGIGDLTDSLLRDQVKDSVVGESGPLRWMTDRGTEVVGLDDLPEPDETYAEGGISLNASAEASVLTDSASAGVSTAQVLGTRTRRDGTTTVYLSATVEGRLGLQSLGLDPDGLELEGASLSGSADVVTAVTFDREGTMVDVQATATTTGESSGLATALFGGTGDDDLADSESGTTVYQSTLDISDDDDRAVAGRFLLAQGVGALGGWTNPVVAAPIVAADLSFFDAARDRGTTTRQDYRSDLNTIFAFDGSGRLGVELGASGSVSRDSLSVSNARYWDGTSWVDWDACTA